MLLQTIEVEKPWGRDRLPAGFADPRSRRIGEIWFDDAGQDLPILVKWLFTSEKLSIQVHPDDAHAAARGLSSGKEECWVIAAAEPGACVGLGLTRTLSPAELRVAAMSGEIEQLVEWMPVRAGDYFFVAPGTIHAIGGGVTLIEVQQHAETTYRLYDYGRPRDLHLDDAIVVARPGPYAGDQSGHLSSSVDPERLISSEHLELWQAREPSLADLAADLAPCWVVPLEGTITAAGHRAGVGDCLYLQPGESITPGERCHALVARHRVSAERS